MMKYRDKYPDMIPISCCMPDNIMRGFLPSRVSCAANLLNISKSTTKHIFAVRNVSQKPIDL